MLIAQDHGEFVPALRLGVVGSGAMGRGIAQIAASAGFAVSVYDAVDGRAEEALRAINSGLTARVAAGKLPPEAVAACCDRLSVATRLEDFAGAAVVFEAVVEDLEVKREVFHRLEQIVSPDCILATNTSSLLVTSIARGCRHPERVVGAHFFNPVPAMKIVELISGAKTDDSFRDALGALVRRMGHAPVVAADSPGFLVNHAGRALYTEGARIVGEGVASPHQVDRVMREAAGFRMGPFELFDLTGLDVSFRVLTQIYDDFYQEPRFRPSPLLRRQVEAGLFGRKVGEGFYRYENGRAVVIAPETPAPGRRRRILVDPRDAEDHAGLIAGLRRIGLKCEIGAPPGEADDILALFPIGDDATSTAVARGLDPERVMAIDPLSDAARHVTVMPTVVTRGELRDDLAGMIAAAGTPVTLLKDSPGFVAQRMLAMIVNVAADIAQQRIASPKDIDFAVRVGLGYPAGPFELGDRLGAGLALTILDRLHAFYGDPRYRASPWLKRRALLGCSLFQEDA